MTLTFQGFSIPVLSITKLEKSRSTLIEVDCYAPIPLHVHELMTKLAHDHWFMNGDDFLPFSDTVVYCIHSSIFHNNFKLTD